MFIPNTSLRSIIITALLVTLSACERSPSKEAPHQPDTRSVSNEHTESEPLSLPLRLAFMTGHVKAGLALYRAGEPEMAAPHLLHPVSETHIAEREGLDKFGFDGALFEVVSLALDAGRPAEEIDPQLIAAEANLDSVAKQVGGDPSEIIIFLLDTIIEEYTISMTDGRVSDPGEYQDAYGFAIVARDHIVNAWGEDTALLATINDLINLWPTAPIPSANPTQVSDVVAHATQLKKVIKEKASVD